MSWYYKQEFISPSSIYARVKEELRSYFEAGLVDDLLFPIWTNDCIRRFRKSALPIKEAILFIDCNEAKLPPDFHKVREARACFFVGTSIFNVKGAFYISATTKVTETEDGCSELVCDLKPCEENMCLDENTIKMYEGIYKTNLYNMQTITVAYYLKPGNVSAIAACGDECGNLGSTSPEVFDIKDGNFVTNFDSGTVYLKYYANEYDQENYQLIPDNYFFARYLEAYLKFKVFEQLWNQVTDETFNQIQTKYQIYKQNMNEAFVLAEQEFRSQTVQQKLNSIAANRRRLNKFRLR